MPTSKSGRPQLKKSFPRSPYLSWAEDPTTTITIKYATSHLQADTIFYNCEEELGYQAETGPGTEKEVTLRNLKPGTQYRYQIGRQGEVYSFQTAPAEPLPFSFVVYGDYSQLGNNKVKQRLYKSLQKDNPAFIIFTGDLVPNGNYPAAWRNEFFPSIKELSPSIPLMAVPGNHDGKGTLFKYYFHYPQNRSWYSFYYSNALFLAVNTQVRFAPGSLQYNFIVETLQQAKSQWKFVYLHQPPYSTNSGHHSNLKVRAVLCPLFEKYGVDVVFAGHNHAYERTHPIKHNRIELEKGVTYITSGGGGAVLLPFIPKTKLARDEKQWSLVRIKDYHYLQVMLAANRLEVKAKNLQGKIIDRFEKTK